MGLPVVVQIFISFFYGSEQPIPDRCFRAFDLNPGYHLVNDIPTGKTAEIVVIDVDVGNDLVGCATSGFEERAFRTIAVVGVEIEAAFAAVFNGVIQ